MDLLKKDLITTRRVLPTDLGFIFSSWLKGLYYGNDWFREIDQEAYFEKYHQIVEAILFKPTTTVTVACLVEDPDVLLGYAIYETLGPVSTLHWVFVKPVWRKLGIAKSVVPKNVTIVTHLSKVGLNIKPKEWKFNPFLS